MNSHFLQDYVSTIESSQKEGQSQDEVTKIEIGSGMGMTDYLESSSISVLGTHFFLNFGGADWKIQLMNDCTSVFMHSEGEQASIGEHWWKMSLVTS